MDFVFYRRFGLVWPDFCHDQWRRLQRLPSSSAHPFDGCAAVPQTLLQRERRTRDTALGRDPTWQYFSGHEYFERQWPCDPTQLGRFSKALGEEGVEELLARTQAVPVTLKLIAKKELTRVIVDSTVQEKAVAHPTDTKLLETARSKVVEVAKANGIELKQTYAKEGQLLGYKAGRYAHARQFKHSAKSSKASEPSLDVCSAMWLAR
jgi:hypothetical protein